MKTIRLIRLPLLAFALGISFHSAWGQNAVPPTARPAAFVYVKDARQKVKVKPAGHSDWHEIRKFGRLFSGRFDEKATRE